MAEMKFTPLAAGLDTSPAHPDADLITLAHLGDKAEAEWAAAPEESEARADIEPRTEGLRRAIASIPAQTFAGLAVKLRLAADGTPRDFATTNDVRALFSARDDAERLANGARPDADLVVLFQAGEHVEAGERHAMLRKMAATPARTPSGIAIKVQALVDEFDVIGSSAHGPDVLGSILDDLKRWSVGLGYFRFPAPPGQAHGLDEAETVAQPIGDPVRGRRAIALVAFRAPICQGRRRTSSRGSACRDRFPHLGDTERP